jgi:glycosyltransferase involved in cell wall biosynthesis
VDREADSKRSLGSWRFNYFREYNLFGDNIDLRQKKIAKRSSISNLVYKMIKISAVISAFNEEENLSDCLSSISWVDEIIVVDNSSTDKTPQIAQKFGAKVFKRPNFSMLNINKNFGFEKAKGKWILNLDADERVSKELKEEIQSLITNYPSSIDGYWIPRKNIIFGKWIKHGLWYPDYQLRLFKRGKGKFPCKHIHEKIQVKGKTSKLKGHIIHYNYTSVSQYLKKIDQIYSSNEAENFLKAGKKLHWYDALRFPASDFLKNFFALQGYKDGLHGLVACLFQAFYSFVVFAKIWEKQGFWEYQSKNFLKEIEKESDKLKKDWDFWVLKEKRGNYLQRVFFKLRRFL